MTQQRTIGTVCLLVSALALVVPWPAAMALSSPLPWEEAGVSTQGVGVCRAVEGTEPYACIEARVLTHRPACEERGTTWMCHMEFSLALVVHTASPTCGWAWTAVTGEAGPLCRALPGAESDTASSHATYIDIPPEGKVMVEEGRACVDWGSSAERCEFFPVVFWLPGAASTGESSNPLCVAEVNTVNNPAWAGCAQGKVTHTEPACSGIGEDYRCVVEYSSGFTLAGSGAPDHVWASLMVRDTADHRWFGGIGVLGRAGGFLRLGPGVIAVEYSDIGPVGLDVTVRGTLCIGHGEFTSSPTECVTWNAFTIHLPPESGAGE